MNGTTMHPIISSVQPDSHAIITTQDDPKLGVRRELVVSLVEGTKSIHVRFSSADSEKLFDSMRDALQEMV
jgi:hypothetical protein